MILVLRPVLVVLLGIGLMPAAVAAGNGSGAGGAGRQRAINSGLPPGEPGPPGSPNNRRVQTPPPSGVHGSPRREVETEK